MKMILFRFVLVFLITTVCTGDIERNGGSTDPSTWLVFGSALEQGNNYLSGRAELCIQPRNWDGQDMPVGEDADRLVVRIDPPQADQSLSVGEKGELVLNLRWRLAGVTHISITLDGSHVGASPFFVQVSERYLVEVRPLLPPPPPPPQLELRGNAYATILTSDAFCTGALVLHHTLKLTSTRYPVLALATSLVTEQCTSLLLHSGMRLVHVPSIPNPNAFHKEHFADVYAKLHVFGLSSFDRIVYLDADVIVLQNIDSLFLQPPLSAASEINPPILFNSGLLVLAPSTSLFSRLYSAAALLPAYDKTDQGLLNEMFMGIWNSVPYTYNFLKDRGALPDRFDTFVEKELQDVHAVHIVGEKPWLCSSDVECNVQGRLSPRLWQLWLRFFHEMCSGLGDVGRLFTCTDLGA